MWHPFCVGAAATTPFGEHGGIRPSGRAPDRGVRRLACMIRKLKSGGFRLYSRKKNPRTGKRRNLGTFKTVAAAKRHERAVQFFKRH